MCLRNLYAMICAGMMLINLSNNVSKLTSIENQPIIPH